MRCSKGVGQKGPASSYGVDGDAFCDFYGSEELSLESIKYKEIRGKGL